MPRLKRKDPSYRHHKASGQAVVTLGGIDHYLGAYDTKASRQEYDRLLSEWKASGKPDAAPTAEPTVAEVVNAYRKFAASYFIKNGKPTSEVTSIKYVSRPLLKLYADLPASKFGPLALKAVREQMIKLGWVRTNINRQVNRIRSIFKWASENEIIPPSISHGLATLKALKEGRTEAVESEPVTPVPDAYVEAVKALVNRHVRAMIDIQLLTGMRPGEVVQMTTGNLDMTGDVWEYRPARHKTQHRGRQRIIPIGPQAQEVLKPFLRPVLDEPLFNPREAFAEHRAEMASKGKRRRANQKRNAVRTPRRIKDRYDVAAYRHAISRACDHANALERKRQGKEGDWDTVYVPRWHPHQLRHNYATAVRRKFGLEVARATLGHSSVEVTELYAEIDLQKAAEVAARIG